MPSASSPPPPPPAPFRPAAPLAIGLLGGIAAGKSTVASVFAAHGLAVLDADRVAREVVDEPGIRAAIAARFGAQVAGPGGLDRRRLADLVFADPAARSDLESITHPAIRRRLLDGLAAAKAAGQSVLFDVPLLLEGPLHEHCDVLVFVDVPDAVRAARAAARGWTADELARREAAQLPLAVKRARASHTIANDGSRERLAAAVAELLARLQSQPPTRRP